MVPEAYSFGQSPIIVGRVPILPLAVAQRINDSEDIETALRELVNKYPFVPLAIGLASPSALASLHEVTEHRPVDRKKLLRLVAYVLRMSTRSTPFGLFASVGVVPAGNTTSLGLAGFETLRTRTRPDMRWVLSLVTSIEDDSALSDRLVVYANDLAIECGDRLVVMDQDKTTSLKRGDHPAIDYTPVSLRLTEGVQKVREWSREGDTIGGLVRRVVDHFGLPEVRARAFIDKLRSAGVFTSVLRPSPTDHPVEHSVNLAVELRPELQNAVTRLYRDIRSFDDEPITVRTMLGHSRIVQDLNEISGSSGATVQVDMAHDFTGTLGRDLLGEVRKLAMYLMRCGRPIRLGEFRDRFAARYGGVERLVPLLELVNPDTGLIAPEVPMTSGDDHDSVEISAKLALLASGALANHQIELALSEGELENLIPPLPSSDALPNSLEIGFYVCGSSAAEINSGSFRIAPGVFVGTYRGGRSVGRFAGLLDAELLRQLGSELRAAGDANAIEVELVYNPVLSQLTNMAVRPCFADYELQIGIHHQAERHRIPADDLVVGLEDDRFFLWSRRLQSRVRVVESHLLNTARWGQGLCRFLALLEIDGLNRFLGFDWHQASVLPFLPRVRCGRVVLSPARWRLDRNVSYGETARWIAERKRDYLLPRFVYLVHYDNKLFLDLESKHAAPILRDQAKPALVAEMHLEEVLPEISQDWLERGAEKFAVEFVASLFRNRDSTKSAIRLRPTIVNARDRLRGPGSEWFYVRLFLGPNLFDGFLRDRIVPLMASAGCPWFFVRYADPFPHIRVRVWLSEKMTDRTRSHLIKEFETLMNAGSMHRYVIDTYEREIERYGGLAATNIYEALFCLDTSSVLGALRPGVSSIDRIRDCIVALDDSLREAFPGDAIGEWIQVSRPPKKKLASTDWPVVKAVQREIQRRRVDNVITQFRRPFSDLRKLESNGTLERPFYQTFQSYAHMHANRFGLSSAEENLAKLMQWHSYYGLSRAEDETT